MQHKLQEIQHEQAQMKDKQKGLVEALKQQDQQMRYQRAQMMNQAPQIVINGGLNFNVLGDQGVLDNFAANIRTHVSRMSLRRAAIEDADSDSETEDIIVLRDYKDY